MLYRWGFRIRIVVFRVYTAYGWLCRGLLGARLQVRVGLDVVGFGFVYSCSARTLT